MQNFLRDFFRRWRPPERQPDWPTSEEVGHLKPLVRAKDEELVLFTSQKPEEPVSDVVVHVYYVDLLCPRENFNFTVSDLW